MAITNIRVSQLFPTTEKGLFRIAEEAGVSEFSIFAIIRTKPFPDKLVIKAIRETQEEDIELTYLPEHFYFTDVPGIGKFYFAIENPKDFYTLNEKGEREILSVLNPINTEQFEKACKIHRFFFVG